MCDQTQQCSSELTLIAENKKLKNCRSSDETHTRVKMAVFQLCLCEIHPFHNDRHVVSPGFSNSDQTALIIFPKRTSHQELK